MAKIKRSKTSNFKFPKSITGIQGLDVITNGGIPKNRPTLIVGNAGCGKTIMAMEFLIRGIELFNEPAVFMTFEEKTEELVLNVRSLGFDIKKHLADNKMYLEYVKVNQDEREAGKYDIEGLFVRLGQAIDRIKAKRVVLDSLDTLFFGFDATIIRAEFRRLLTWLKERNVTAIITGEAGTEFYTKHGIEEYVADCVMVLDNRVINQISTRRLRIVKYRGSIHGNNEYPFIIYETGITVLPVTSNPLKQKSSSQRISCGIKAIDEMLDLKGFFVGSSVLISGTAGTGKTSVAAAFADSVSKSKHRCLFCAFEEAPNQIMRNMKSIGFDLNSRIRSGLLSFYSARPSLQNLELHFIAIKKIIKETNPSVVILDPITNLMTEGPNSDIRGMLTRFVDYLKTEEITVLFTAAITVGSIEQNPSDEGISSMVDTWMMVQDIEVDGERTRSLCVMKSRGMKHSNQVKRFDISSKGIAIGEINRNIDTGEKRKLKEHTNLSTSKE
ncbi:MAG: circadian clock protein KaiC [Bacteroidia bacterium]